MRYVFLLLSVAALSVTALIIRHVISLEAFRLALPYLFIGPAAFILLRWAQLRWLSRPDDQSASDMAQDFYAGALITCGVLLISLGSFQHVMKRSLWDAAIGATLMILFMAPQWAHNRLTRGIWIVRRRPLVRAAD